MHTVVEMPEFIRSAKKAGTSDDERQDIVDLLASDPTVGDEIAGTGGMRKVRIAGKGKGKRGGYRLITFFSGENLPVFLITMYAKNQQDNITDKQSAQMKQLSKMIIKSYRSKKHE